MAKWLGSGVFATAAVDLLILDAAETVTPDLLRLYRDAGPVSASWLLVVGGWATGARLLLSLTVDALLPPDAFPVRVGLAFGAYAATLGGLLMSTAVPMFFVGFGR